MPPDLELLDGAVPLVRGDEPWEWFAVFWEDIEETTPTDLTGKTVAAEIRWILGAQAVTVDVADPASGQARLSLTAAETESLPLGQLCKLFLAIGTNTEGVVPVNVVEGLYT